VEVEVVVQVRLSFAPTSLGPHTSLVPQIILPLTFFLLAGFPGGIPCRFMVFLCPLATGTIPAGDLPCLPGITPGWFCGTYRPIRGVNLPHVFLL